MHGIWQAFKPSDPDVLATCSFDGSLRVWNTRTNKMMRDLSVNSSDRALFSLSWAPPYPPHDGKIVTASAAGRVLLWDIDAGVQERSLAVADNVPCYGVDW